MSAISIFGWGHNHRGQLGGVEGNKVKLPRLLENFSELSPLQIVGGEQTLFAVTSDGKVILYSTLMVLYIHNVVYELYGLCMYTC